MDTENEFTVEKSEQQAVILKQMGVLALTLDIDYLRKAVKEMEDNHRFRDSAAILNPSPFTHQAQQDLNTAKLIQLNNFISIAETALKIIEATKELSETKRNINQLNSLFGL